MAYKSYWAYSAYKPYKPHNFHNTSHLPNYIPQLVSNPKSPMDVPQNRLQTILSK